ncbi:MAG: 23S rRNA (adenine(2503)-C(2))-methyltransferase RlmN [Kiritimatiellae bacterium]|nr:23S rRNA (adenine(2503)-C(2))-methyltransferase RlmN [Kiritimatiellia bacterium]
MTPPTAKPTLLDLTPEEWRLFCERNALPKFRAKQILEWLYVHQAASPDAMLNLPPALRVLLADTFDSGRHPPVRTAESTDGTKKYLFQTHDGQFVETAMIPDGDRKTLCLSTQVGCRRACSFCMTGQQRFHGNLSASDILNQYLSCPERDGITNIVYMGMGEPLDNYEEVARSLTLFTSPDALAKSPTRLTVSTVGILPTLKRYIEECSCHLAISLHAPTHEERLRLMPVEKQYPLAEVIRLLREHPFTGQRRLTFEYAMIQNSNDSAAYAREVAALLRGMHCRVNLIPCNPLPDANLLPSPRPVIETFQNMLKRAGITTTIRKSKGQDILAACGLLSTKHQSNTPC